MNSLEVSWHPPPFRGTRCLFFLTMHPTMSIEHSLIFAQVSLTTQKLSILQYVFSYMFSNFHSLLCIFMHFHLRIFIAIFGNHNFNICAPNHPGKGWPPPPPPHCPPPPLNFSLLFTWFFHQVFCIIFHLQMLCCCPTIPTLYSGHT